MTYRLQRLHIDKNVLVNVGSVQQVTLAHFQAIAQMLEGLMDFIKLDQDLQSDWIEQDRPALLHHARPIFKNILSKQQVTHFYFIGLEKTCFLRVHRPDYHGDLIRRHTLDQSELVSAPVSGIELGPFGTLTFRLVQPWWIKGKLTGFIELGVEIENLAPKLKKILGSDLIFTVNKSFLKRENWEEGMRMMGRNANWDQFSDYIIISNTLKEIPSKLGQHKQLDAVEREGHIFNMPTGDRQHYGGFVPLVDAGNNIIGDIIVLKDITAEESALQTLSIIMTVACIVIGIFLIGFFYYFVGRIERRLEKSRRALTDEIVVRRETEEALQQARDKLEMRVKERTVELSHAIKELQRQMKERERTEVALRESETKYSTLVEDALMGVSIIQNGKIQFANEKFAEIFGYSRDDLKGMDSLELIHPEDRDVIKEIREKRLNGEDAPSEYEVRGLRRDGKTIWIVRSNALIQYQNHPAIAGNIIDISHRKEMEQRILQSEKEHRILSGQLLSVEENERKRIASEIHDSIGQALSAIKFALENTIVKLRPHAAKIDISALNSIVPLAQKTIEEVRRIVMDLRPSILDDLGILATINWFCREFESIYAYISIQKEIYVQEQDIPIRLKTGIYRILQEALNNVTKHSEANKVKLGLRLKDRRIELCIEDNGKGFDVDSMIALQSERLGVGLASIRERAELSGGTHAIASHMGSGTRISVWWPVTG